MKYFTEIMYSFLGILLLLPAYVFSQSGTDNTGDSPNANPLKNPLGDKDIIQFLQDILGVIMVFAVPLIVFMFIYAGFLFVMDRGSEKNLAQAKRALLYSVIGAVIILGAEALLFVIQGTVDALR